MNSSTPLKTQLFKKLLFLASHISIFSSLNLALAESKQKRDSLLFALKDFNFEQYHSNLGDIKTISFEHTGSRMENDVTKSSEEYANGNENITASGPEIDQTEKVEQTEVILAQSTPGPSIQTPPSLAQVLHQLLRRLKRTGNHISIQPQEILLPTPLPIMPALRLSVLPTVLMLFIPLSVCKATELLSVEGPGIFNCGILSYSR